MDDKPAKPASLEETCLFHLIALKYAMAGDLESAELIQQLETRWYKINWSDPAFVEFSDAMRNGPAHLVSQDAPTQVQNLKSLVHDQGEVIAGLSEGAALIIQQHKDAQKKVVPAIEAGIKVLKYMADLINLTGRMRQRLHTLGDDTSVFVLPESPFPPIN